MSKKAIVLGVTVDELNEKRFPVKLHVFSEPYEFNGKSGVSVVAELIEPFPEYAEDFNHIRIAPRWDSDTAIFKFRMGLYLKTNEEPIIEGECRAVGYESKKPEDKGKMIYYPGLFFKFPYSKREIEFGFKKRKVTENGITKYSDSPDSYVFRDLVAERWGGTFEPGIASATDDVDDE